MTKAKHTFKVGGEVEFTGYTQLAKGQEEILVVGQKYKILSVNEETGGIEVIDKNGVGDTVFDDEIAPVTKAKKTTASKPKAKATAKPKAATKPKAKTTKAKTTGKAKSTKVEKTETPANIVAIVPPITDSESVSEILEGKDMLTAAKELAVAAEETFISLGGVLKHIYDTGAHHSLGYTGKRGFADYMLNELNIQYRKGMYLIEIYNVARRFELDERKLAEIGWSKMKEIANKIDAENAAELLEYAAEHTREELVDYVRTTHVNGGASTVERVKKTRLTFNLFGDQAETVQRAIEEASKQIDNATPEQALVLITAEWSQQTESVDLPVDQAVEALIARYGEAKVKKALTASTEKKSAERELVTA